MAAPAFPVDRGPRYLAFGDVNQNGVVDIVVSSEDGHVLSVLTSSASGAFSRLGQTIDLGRNLGQVAIQDFTEDGLLDIGVINESGGAQNGDFFLVPGSGPGTFAPAIDLEIPDRRLESMVSTDFDRAFGPDFAIAHGRSGVVRVYLNNEDDSGFTQLDPIEVRDAPRMLAFGQLTRDSLPELVVLNTSPAGGDEVVILQPAVSDGAIQFTIASQRPLDSPAVVSMTVSDVNRDGLGDILVLHEQVNRRYGITTLLNTTTSALDSPITFEKIGPVTYECPRPFGEDPFRCNPVDLASADFDRDNRPDLAVSLNVPGGVDFLTGLGDGAFVPANAFIEMGSRPSDLVLADVTGDRQVDVVVADSDAGVVTVLRNALPPGLNTGEVCSQGNQCNSTICLDEVCCTSASCPSGQRCDIPGSQGFCAPLRSNGSPCSEGNTCASSLCTDGVCCNAAACGAGLRCDVPGQAGLCTAPPPTATPTRTPTATPTPQPLGRDCATNRQCVSNACVDGICCAESCEAGRFCNISGSVGTCAFRKTVGETCQQDTDCLSDYCTGGQCRLRLPTPTPTPVVTRKPGGSTCNADFACESGLCTDGVCCSERRCAVGERCDIFGSKGECVAQLPPDAACEKSSDCADGRACEEALDGFVCSRTPAATPLPVACVGDCSADGVVTVDELLTMIDIALGQQPVTSCDAGDLSRDGQISVDEVITAVGFALSGCPQGPTPPPTEVDDSTPTPTDSTPSATPTASATAAPPTETPSPTIAPPTPTPAALDLSGFNEFQFDRFGGAGFCAPLGQVFSATIRRQGAQYLLEATTLAAGNPQSDDCLEDYIGPADCAVVVPAVASTPLSENELSQVLGLFKAVTVLSSADPDCATAEPCVVNVARWDELETADYVCLDSNRLPANEALALTEMLNGLIAGHQP